MDLSINDTDHKGNTTLHRAIMTGDFEGLEKILANTNINVNAKNNEGATPLISAAERSKCNTDFLKYLLKHPSLDVNSQNLKKQTALHMAILNKQTDLVHCLLTNPNIDVNTQDGNGNTAWTLFSHEILSDPDNQLLKLFLDLPSLKVNDLDARRGNSILMNMIQKSSKTERMKLLLTRPDLDVNQSDRYGNSALMLAAKFHCIDILELLLNCPNISVNQQNSNGETALIIGSGNLAITKMILNDPKTDIYVMTEGKTALRTLLSRISPDKEILDLLQRHPTYDINRINYDGCTDLHWAVKHVWELKKSNNYYSLVPFQHLMMHPHINVSLLDNNGNTALSLAAKYMDTNMMKALSGHCSFDKANFNQQNNRGTTFLHLLSQAMLYPTDVDIQYLLQLLNNSAIDINIQDNKGYTAIMHTLTNQIHFIPDIVTCLLNHPNKCDLSKRNIYDQTVLDIMEADIHSVDPKVQSLLKKHGGLKTMAYLSDISIIDQIKFLRKSVNASSDLNLDGKEYIKQQLDCLESDLEELSKGNIGSEFGMIKLHRDKLLGCRKFLLDNLSPHEVLNHLLQDKILTTNNMEDILVIKSRYKMVTRLLSLLPMRGPNSYNSFITALNETGQEYIAEELEKFDPSETNNSNQSGIKSGQVIPYGVNQAAGSFGSDQASSIVLPVDLPSSGSTSVTLWFNTKG